MKITKLIEALKEAQEKGLAQNDEIQVAFHFGEQIAAGEIHGFEIAKHDLAGTRFDGLPTLFLAAGQMPEGGE